MFQIGNQIFSLLLLLQTCKHHFRPWYVLFGIGQIRIECVLVPYHSSVLIGGTVRVVGRLARFSSENSMQIGPHFVFAAIFDGVTLRARTLEQFLTLFYIAHVAMANLYGNLLTQNCQSDKTIDFDVSLVNIYKVFEYKNFKSCIFKIGDFQSLFPDSLSLKSIFDWNKSACLTEITFLNVFFVKQQRALLISKILLSLG